MLYFIMGWSIGIMFRMSANSPKDRGSITGQVIPKTQKVGLDASLFNTEHYKMWIKGKWSNPGKVVAPTSTLWCCSY